MFVSGLFPVVFTLFVISGMALFRKSKGTRMSTIEFDTEGLENYLTDADLEVTGVWLRFPGDRRFLCRRAGGSNKEYFRKFQKLIRPHRVAFDRGVLDPDVQNRIMRELYADTIVTDWKGVKAKDGKELLYSPELAMKYFKMFPDLFADLITLCTDAANYSQKLIDNAVEDLGKS